MFRLLLVEHVKSLEEWPRMGVWLIPGSLCGQKMVACVVEAPGCRRLPVPWCSG